MSELVKKPSTGSDTDSSNTPAFLNIFEDQFEYDSEQVAQAREAHWYAQTPIGPIVLRHAEAYDILRDRRLVLAGHRYMRSQNITEGPLYDWFTGMLVSQNGSDHARLRGLVSNVFTSRFVATLSPAIQKIAELLADGIAGSHEGEFMDAFADRFAGLVICQMLGVPPEDYDQFHHWVRDIGLVFTTASERPRTEAAIVGMTGYIESLIDARRRDLREDLLSSLITAADGGDRLTPKELTDMVLLLFWAGQDTTALQLGRAMLAFANHPDQWQLLRERPDLAPQAVEEICRYTPQSRITFRFAAEDAVYRDLKIPAESMVLIGIATGNRDPRAFENPERFDISAPRERSKQLVFGGGVHMCLGQHMARLEMAVALTALTQRLGPPSVVGPVEWLPHTAMIHGPLSLPLRFGKRS
ncbi:cytochrome P450 [Granulicella sp. S190]|uniref:cytochrome P450 n=1 Tax=Granulicella sp. S190 TaxID=1747226 RepID=UPI00131BFEC5|nr:cytochrome P450 [Granulicella sp. S190]